MSFICRLHTQACPYGKFDRGRSGKVSQRCPSSSNRFIDMVTAIQYAHILMIHTKTSRCGLMGSVNFEQRGNLGCIKWDRCFVLGTTTSWPTIQEKSTYDHQPLTAAWNLCLPFLLVVTHHQVVGYGMTSSIGSLFQYKLNQDLRTGCLLQHQYVRPPKQN